MPSNAHNLWVGVFPKTGALIVFDPLLQIADQPEINVYSVHRDLVRKFEPSEIRTSVLTIYGSERTASLEKYASWKQLYAEAFLHGERGRIEVERARLEAERNQIIERHKQFIAASGNKYVGTALGYPKVRRITHCWSCRSPLDNEVNVECLSCGWIICGCGACGCGRNS